MKNIRITRARFIVACIGIIIFVLFTPLVSFFFNFGSLVGMSIGAVIVLAAVFFEQIKGFFALNLKKKWFRLLFIIICVIAAAVVVILSVFLYNILNSAFFTSEPPEDATVIVLGCQVRATGEPSKTLRQRLDRAYEYLTENENAVCIVSGGQGPDEPQSEARVMRDYLIERGISADRIIMEDESHDTNQNMRYSAQIIEREGLSREIAVITNSFHQYRASTYASHYGLNAHSVNSETDPFAYPTYLLREIFAVVKMKLITG